jgi:hypothetical protein
VQVTCLSRPLRPSPTPVGLEPALPPPEGGTVNTFPGIRTCSNVPSETGTRGRLAHIRHRGTAQTDSRGIEFAAGGDQCADRGAALAAIDLMPRLGDTDIDSTAPMTGSLMNSYGAVTMKVTAGDVDAP